uniref:Uncharacterized protein n=1 Tax=Romanomermis culicivorax TaxID=13658 RepID=A0A915JEJ8_ROMCU
MLHQWAVWGACYKPVQMIIIISLLNLDVKIALVEDLNSNLSIHDRSNGCRKVDIWMAISSRFSISSATGLSSKEYTAPESTIELAMV